jgi:hypothetical protein
VVKSALFGAPQTFSNTSTATRRSLSGIVVAKGALRGAPDSPAYKPSTNVEKLVWQCCCKGALRSAPGSPPVSTSQTSTATRKTLAGNVVAKAPSAVLQALDPSSPHRPPQQRGKAWLAMLLQRRPLQHFRLSTSQTSTARGKSLSGNVLVKIAPYGCSIDIPPYTPPQQLGKVCLAVLLQRAPSVVVLPTLQLIHLHGDEKSLAGKCCCKGTLRSAPGSPDRRLQQQWVKACLPRL